MSISRMAILIGETSTLPGVAKDMQDIKNFLISSRGGNWTDEEIIVLKNTNKDTVRMHLNNAKKKDYVFITCSGHGEHIKGEYIDSTVMELNTKETISINSINPENKRHLVIVDVCRKLKIIKSESMRVFSESLYESAYFIDNRKKFDDAVMACAEGRIVAYSCDINQAAGETERGGYFTQSLLSSKNLNKNIVSIKDAFDYAQQETYRLNAPQSPVFCAGRRKDFFPFKV